MRSARRGRRLGDGRQGHAVSRDDSDDKAKDDLVRQAAAKQRTVTPRRHTMRRHGGRLGIGKARRVVTQGESSRKILHSPAFFRTGTAPQDTPDKRGGPPLLRRGKTRTETAVGSDAISPSRCGKTTASDITAKTKPLGEEGGWTASMRGQGQGEYDRT
ncbi:hypothetical protein A4X09_0g7605 [Tilletia walkeri]|uniref:Uncharacterized protein n=1 Tax=Tilletia walkeri TaxID=117179 RepID=A0A8X7N356_9BASI|nr:hypothetical protein A4X09_0g7605 [Tilletia walkeri]